MSAVLRNVAIAALALGSASCVSLAFRRDILEARPPASQLAGFSAGTTQLGEVLAKLGAPLDVWEAGGGRTAMTYGGLRNSEWNVDVSVPVTDTTSASLSYTESRARTEGHMLIFGRDDRLQLVREGNLADLRKELERRSASDVDDELDAAPERAP